MTTAFTKKKEYREYTPFPLKVKTLKRKTAPNKKLPGEKSSEYQLLRPDRVAKILDVSRRRVYTLIGEGALEALRTGKRQIRITRRGLESFIEKRKKARRVELGLEEE